jgi:beta-lactamase regulating signal transducer with metallopeptidase domain
MINSTLLSQPIFQALGWALIHFIWQGALVALLYASLRVMLRRRTAHVRYAVACCALLLMFALPAATTLIIKRALELKASAAQEMSRDVSMAWKSNATTAEAASAAGQKQATWTATETASPANAATVRGRFARLLPWLVSIWLVGVLILSLRVLGGWAMAQRLKSWKTVPATERWQEIVSQLSRRLKVSRTVRLCESIVAEVPTVIGWLRPVILVPVSAFVGLSPQQIEAVLAHELAHIRRHDYLINLFQTAVETLLFYHPAVWWVSRQIRTEREHCCDDLAVAACGNVLTYARALAELEQLRGTGAMLPQLAVAADGGGSLLKRIQRLVETPASPHQRSSAWLASFVAIATIFCICVGARTTLFSREAENKQTRAAGPSTLQKLLMFESGSGSPSNAQAQSGEQAREFQILMPQIRASVNVTASVAETDESQANPVNAPLVVSGTPTESVAPVIATTQTSATQTNAVSYTYDYKLQDDEDAPSSGYVDAMAAVGYTKLSVDQLVEMKQHGVTPGYVRELKAMGYPLPSADTVVELIDHGVTIDYIKKLGALGYRNLAFDDLVEAVDHGVRPDVIEAFSAEGYNNLTMDQLVEAVDHGVRPGYIRAMAELGFGKLTLDQLVQMVDHGVRVEFVKEIKSLGYNNLSAAQFIRLCDHGVSAAFVRKARERGFNNLSLDELIKLKDAGIL